VESTREKKDAQAGVEAGREQIAAFQSNRVNNSLSFQRREPQTSYAGALCSVKRGSHDDEQQGGQVRRKIMTENSFARDDGTHITPLKQANFDVQGAVEVAQKLLDYCRRNEWSGHDPYDALNSKLLRLIPMLDSRIFRLALTQALKRSSIDLRRLLRVSPSQNPKAIALFLMSFLKLSKLGLLSDDDLVAQMIGKLIALRSPGFPYWCWGYSFPWQSRKILVARGVPNLICTTFVANALFDAYESSKVSEYLSMALSAARYIVDVLYWTEGQSAAGFRYPHSSMQSSVHNANFLGAALLCRAYKHCAEKSFLDIGLKVARYSASKQHKDGSWYYGEAPGQIWIDNFHTGYNLCALREICEFADISAFEGHISRGFAFYERHFFREDGAAKYFSDRTYPIDIHSAAQSIITLLRLRDLNQDSVKLAHRVFEWTVNHMWDEKGFFYYQVGRLSTNKISYMRWSQAWMLLALSTLLECCDKEATVDATGQLER
jgi:hypothetical protein